MTLSNLEPDLELTEEEKRLRDGIFNLETIRFGKIPEIMIKKKYGYSFPDGTTEYDLKSDSGEHIEVKFSCVREKENDITEENALSVCLENAELRTDRKVKSYEYRDVIFDCNIQQIKPDLFTSLYYGLFFEDVIAIFKMTSEDMRSFYLAKHFSSTAKKLEKANQKLHEVKNKLQTSSGGRATEKYVVKRIEEDIPQLLVQIYDNLKKIGNSKSQSHSLARNIIIENDLLKGVSKTIKYITDSSKKISRRIEKCEQLIDKLDDIIVLESIPNSSTKQHLKSDGEGQFHIKNTNFEWHVNSVFFSRLGYI